ncbi:MAG: hypothetical protein B0W54_03945 [Cellvibrio sp. 79]|nr:MAG: hypothetical protein B0W54_03945 [Cellvibrio sp. 79]
MKILKMIFAISIFAALSLNANAGTITVKCHWVPSHPGPVGANGFLCYDEGSAVASKRVGTGANTGNCSTYIYTTGYSYTGNTCDPTILKTVPDNYTPPPYCGPNSDELYGDVYVSEPPNGPATFFPTAEVNAYCGACGYNSYHIASYAYGAYFRVYCKH